MALNEFQARSLVVTCQYIDRVVGEIEQVLNAADSKTAFPKFVDDLTPAQCHVIQDYLARIRLLLTRILDRQGIAMPAASIPSSRALFTALLTIDIAVEELRPPQMRGYGELAPDSAKELELACGELQELVGQLNQSLLPRDATTHSKSAWDRGQDDAI